MSQLSNIVTLLKKRNNSIPLDNDGTCYYTVVQVNSDNFIDLDNSIIEQLKKEHKYNYYVSFCSMEKNCLHSEMLPIYGDPKKYITKWFFATKEECIQKDLNDRSMCLYKRIMEFKENKELLNS